MENTNIIPAKINEKPLKILGIISMAGGIGYFVVYLINLFELLNQYSNPFENSYFVEYFFTRLLIITLSSLPFVLFGLYSLFFSKKKINHPVLLISYIILMIYSILSMINYDNTYYVGAFMEDWFEETYYGLECLVEFEILDYLYALSNSAYYSAILLCAFLPIFFVVDIAKNFRLATLSKIIAIIIMTFILFDNMSYFILTIIELIGDEAPVEDTLLPVFELIKYTPFFLFWFLVIKKGAKKIKLAPQPMAQPVYQAPVQPVAQPMYQAPVQPVAQPMYQAPAQPMIRETSPEEKLENFKRLLDDGLISQEDFDKKKAEILDKM